MEGMKRMYAIHCALVSLTLLLCSCGRKTDEEAVGMDMPMSVTAQIARDEALRSVQSSQLLAWEIDDLNQEISDLRLNAEDYPRDEFAEELDRLQAKTEELASRSSQMGADDAVSSLDTITTDLNTMRQDVEDNVTATSDETDANIDLRAMR